MKPIRLRCEYLFSPLGIDVKAPRFSWNAALETPLTLNQGVSPCDVPEACQTAYQIRAFRGKKLIWDTGKVSSCEMINIPYAGERLHSRDRVRWQVRLWDGNNLAGESAESEFEMGLLQKEDWKGHWIGGDFDPAHDHRYPADCFRKIFDVPAGIVRARLYASAMGLYTITLNGEKAGNAYLAPGCTDYRKRVQYQTYDVTSLIHAGAQNVLSAELADGWYRGSLNAFGCTEVYGNRTKLLCQLEITDEAGNISVIGSDDSFDWCNDGPVRQSDLKDGEVIDFRMKPSYKGHARIVPESLMPCAPNTVPVRAKQSFVPRLIQQEGGKTLLDFGQNIAGVMSFHGRGRAGQEIHIRLGEILDSDGHLTLSNIQEKKTARGFDAEKQFRAMTGQLSPADGEIVLTPKQEIRIILSGGDDSYQTQYAYFGFRYAEVETDLPLKADMFRAVAICSDMEETGSFTCGIQDVNRLWQNTFWSMRSNFMDIPTDCPTRERLGWTGDAQIFFRTGTYFYDTASFFTKWLRDLRDAQTDQGLLPAVVPWAGMDMLYAGTGASAGWLDAAILIPWQMYEAYHDTRVLEENYDLMRNTAEYMIRHTGPETEEDAAHNPWREFLYVKGVQLGEWLEPEEYNEPITAESQPRHPEEATAYFFRSLQIMADAAALTGRPEDEKRYRHYSEGARKCYLWEFLRDGAPDTDRQAKLVRPLALGITENMPPDAVGIAPKDIHTRLQNRLALAIENGGYHVKTGFLSTAFLLPELSKMNRPDLAVRVLMNEKAPGWLAQIREGATTIWENWNGSASRNHYSPGTVCRWLMESAAGISLTAPGRFLIGPLPGNALKNTQASWLSLWGMVGAEQKENVLKISLPPNTHAEYRWNGPIELTIR